DSKSPNSLSSFQSRLLEDGVKRSWFEIFGTVYRNHQYLAVLPHDVMAALDSAKAPVILFKQSNQILPSHEYIIRCLTSFGLRLIHECVACLAGLRTVDNGLASHASPPPASTAKAPDPASACRLPKRWQAPESPRHTAPKTRTCKPPPPPSPWPPPTPFTPLTPVPVPLGYEPQAEPTGSPAPPESL